MKFQHTIIQIYIYLQCSMGFRNKLSNLYCIYVISSCNTFMCLSVINKILKSWTSRIYCPIGTFIEIWLPVFELKLAFLLQIKAPWYIGSKSWGSKFSTLNIDYNEETFEKQHKFLESSLWFQPVQMSLLKKNPSKTTPPPNQTNKQNEKKPKQNEEQNNQNG